MVASLLTGGTSPSPIRPPLSGLPNTTTTFEVSFMVMIESKVVCWIWPFRHILWYDMLNSFLGYIKWIFMLLHFIHIRFEMKNNSFWKNPFVNNLRLFMYSIFPSYQRIPKCAIPFEGLCFICPFKTQLLLYSFQHCFQTWKKNIDL